MNRRLTAIQRQFNRSAAGSYDIHARVQRMMADRLSQSIHGWLSEGQHIGPTFLKSAAAQVLLTEILVNEWPGSYYYCT